MDYNFSSSYRTCIRKSQDADRAQIAATFQELLKSGERIALRLVNYYKGLPINYPATPVEIMMGTLDLDVHQQQAVAMSLTPHTFIKCDRFDSAILAEACNVNVCKMTASLRNFCFVEIMAEQRSEIRIEMEPPADAEVKSGGTVLQGKVLDMSLGGVSIRIDGVPMLASGAEVALRLAIPNLLQESSTWVQAKARVIGCTREDGEHICRFSITADVHCEGVMSRFLFQRQVEIVRELKEQA